MLSGLYSAATAMDAAATTHEVVAHNLAFAQMPGFRRSVVSQRTFESALSQAEQDQIQRESWGAGTPVVSVDFTPGQMQSTGQPLDVALQGDAFFVVNGPDGPLYTRNGVFAVNADRTLVTSDGLAVQGQGGAITLPPNVPLSEVVISTDGVVRARNVQVGQLKRVEFADNSVLQPAGATLFSAPDDVRPESSEAPVAQGVRELGNVSPVEELVRLIVGLRNFEAAQHAQQAIARSVEQNTSTRGGQ